MHLLHQIKAQQFYTDLDLFSFSFFLSLLLYIPSQQLDGHGGMVSSSNYTFFLGKLEKAVNQYFLHMLSLVTDNYPSWMIQWKGGEWR